MTAASTSPRSRRKRSRMQRAAVRCAALALASCRASASAPAGAEAPPAEPAKDWEVEIEPYGWLALLHGQIDTAGFGDEEITVDAREVFDSFAIGAMGAVKLRWRRFVALFDVAWAKLSDDGGIGNARVRFDMNQELGSFEALAGYRIYERPGGPVRNAGARAAPVMRSRRT